MNNLLAIHERMLHIGESRHGVDALYLEVVLGIELVESHIGGALWQFDRWNCGANCLLREGRDVIDIWMDKWVADNNLRLVAKGCVIWDLCRLSIGQEDFLGAQRRERPGRPDRWKPQNTSCTLEPRHTRIVLPRRRLWWQDLARLRVDDSNRWNADSARHSEST